jgi:DNA polymerase-3 subunit alpha
MQHAPAIRLAASAAATADEKLAWEKQLLGFYVSSHPLDRFQQALEGAGVTPCNKLPELRSGQRVKVAGVVTKIQRVNTRTGESMLFVTLEDVHGSVEVLVFPKTLKAEPAPWQDGKILLVSGKTSDKDGTPKVLADGARELTRDTTQPDAVVVKIPNAANERLWMTLKDELRRHPGPAKVILSVDGEKRRTIHTNYTVRWHRGLAESLINLLGANAVELP